MKSFPSPNAKYAQARNLITDAQGHRSAHGPLHFHYASGKTYCGLDIQSELAHGRICECTQIYLFNPESKYFAAEEVDFKKLCEVCALRLDDLGEAYLFIKDSEK
jgi:hypothetical protein